MTETLTKAELAAITGRHRAQTQAAELARLGVPFSYTGRSVVVDRAVAAAHQLLPQTRGGINFGAIR